MKTEHCIILVFGVTLLIRRMIYTGVVCSKLQDEVAAVTPLNSYTVLAGLYLNEQL